MECPCPKSASADKSRYFTGMSPPVVFVAAMSFVAFGSVVAAAVVVAAVMTSFFVILPMAAAAGGAFLVVAPEMVSLGTDPKVLLLVRSLGAMMVAYAGGALMVGSSGCYKKKTAYLGLCAAVLGTLFVAVGIDGDALSDDALVSSMRKGLACATGAAVAAALFSAVGPSIVRKIEGEKGPQPGAGLCS